MDVHSNWPLMTEFSGHFSDQPIFNLFSFDAYWESPQVEVCRNMTVPVRAGEHKYPLPYSIQTEEKSITIDQVINISR